MERLHFASFPAKAEPVAARLGRAVVTFAAGRRKVRRAAAPVLQIPLRVTFTQIKKLPKSRKLLSWPPWGAETQLPLPSFTKAKLCSTLEAVAGSTSCFRRGA